MLTVSTTSVRSLCIRDHLINATEWWLSLSFRFRFRSISGAKGKPELGLFIL